MTFADYALHVEQMVDRSAALRDAVRGHLDAVVPGCPGWTGRHLVLHLGKVQRFWAAIVRAGAADGPPDVTVEPPDDDPLEWATAGTETLRAALGAVDPDGAAWTWWGEPRRAHAIARHQVHEAAIHAFDAQEAAGRPEPVPREVARDGIDEFLAIVERCADPWPHPPAVVSVVADDGSAGIPPAWVVTLRPDGARVARGTPGGEATLRGGASDVVLALYRRRGLDTLRVEGDADVAARFVAWPDLD